MRWGLALAAAGLLLAAPAWAAPSKTCAQYGETAFIDWTQGLYPDVGRHFAPDLADHLPASVLHDMWNELQAQVGKFQSLGRFVPRTLNGQAAMVAPITFQHMRMAAVFACNAKDQIAGMQVLDPARVPGLQALLPPASH
ncbi:MAG TPA: hypothetical protein VF292_01750 [Rhodanobacteraceae bacterium]